MDAIRVAVKIFRQRAPHNAAINTNLKAAVDARRHDARRRRHRRAGVRLVGRRWQLKFSVAKSIEQYHRENNRKKVE